MAALATLHADQVALSQRLGGTYRKAGDYAFLTNTTVAAADTYAGLLSAVSAASVHADFVPAKHRVNRALTLGNYSSEVTDARVNALTTVEGLVGISCVTNTNLRDLFLE